METSPKGKIVAFFFATTVATYLCSAIWNATFFGHLAVGQQLASGVKPLSLFTLFDTSVGLMHDWFGDKGLVVFKVTIYIAILLSLVFGYSAQAKNYVIGSFIGAVAACAALYSSIFDVTTVSLLVFALTLITFKNKLCALLLLVGFLFLKDSIFIELTTSYNSAALMGYGFAGLLMLVVVYLILVKKPSHIIFLSLIIICSVQSQTILAFALIFLGFLICQIWGKDYEDREELTGLPEGLRRLSLKVAKQSHIALGISWVLLCFSIVNVNDLLRTPITEAVLPKAELEYVKSQEGKLLDDLAIRPYVVYKLGNTPRTTEVAEQARFILCRRGLSKCDSLLENQEWQLISLKSSSNFWSLYESNGNNILSESEQDIHS